MYYTHTCAHTWQEMFLGCRIQVQFNHHKNKTTKNKRNSTQQNAATRMFGGRVRISLHTRGPPPIDFRCVMCHVVRRSPESEKPIR